MTIITPFYLMAIPSFVYRKFIDYKMAAKNKYKRGDGTAPQQQISQSLHPPSFLLHSTFNEHLLQIGRSGRQFLLVGSCDGQKIWKLILKLWAGCLREKFLFLPDLFIYLKEISIYRKLWWRKGLKDDFQLISEALDRVSKKERNFY
jgi:hypothetical protein